MRRTERKKIFVSIFVVLFIVLILVFQNPFRSFFYSISEPIQSWFWQRGKNSSDFLKGALSFSALSRENQSLKEENMELLSMVVGLEALEKENQELRNALAIGLADDYLLAEARVFSLNLEQDFVLVDKGSGDGIEKGMAVIDFNNVLLGRVEEIYGNRSKVLLLSSQEIKFSAEIGGRKINGLVRGAGKGQVILDIVPKEEELISGSLITTAGLEADFPRGLLVGRIGSIERTDLAPFQKADIELLADIVNQNHLLIILER